MVVKISRVYLIIIPLLLLHLSPVFAQNNTDALSTYRTGRDLESRNHINEADFFYNAVIRICNDEISRNTATADTYTALTWTLQRQRKYADVISWGERGLKLFENEYRLVEVMGEAYFYLEDHEQSLRYMQRYTNSVPRGERSSIAYFFIGEIYRVRKQYHHADIAYSTALQLDPGVALWWYRLGLVREAAGDSAQAITAYEQAVRFNPNYREASESLTRLRTQAN